MMVSSLDTCNRKSSC